MSVPIAAAFALAALIATAAALADSLVSRAWDPADIDPALRTSVRANGAELWR